MHSGRRLVIKRLVRPIFVVERKALSALQDSTVTSPVLCADAEGESRNNTTENRDFTRPPFGYSTVNPRVQCRPIEAFSR